LRVGKIKQKILIFPMLDEKCKETYTLSHCLARIKTKKQKPKDKKKNFFCPEKLF
jgi:hypothetical protein